MAHIAMAGLPRRVGLLCGSFCGKDTLKPIYLLEHQDQVVKKAKRRQRKKFRLVRQRIRVRSCDISSPYTASSSDRCSRYKHIGVDRVYFAGAWMGYRFHEDGFAAGHMVARDLLQKDGVVIEEDCQT